MGTKFIVVKDSFQHSIDPSSGAVDMTPWMGLLKLSITEKPFRE